LQNLKTIKSFGNVNRTLNDKNDMINLIQIYTNFFTLLPLNLLASWTTKLKNQSLFSTSKHKLNQLKVILFESQFLTEFHHQIFLLIKFFDYFQDSKL
jgi:hypothetical protein